MLSFFNEIKNHATVLGQTAGTNQQALELWGILQQFERTNRGHRHLLNILDTEDGRLSYPAQAKTFQRSLTLLLTRLTTLVDDPVRWSPQVEAFFQKKLPVTVQEALALCVRRYLAHWALERLKEGAPTATWTANYAGYSSSTKEDKSISIVFFLDQGDGPKPVGKPVHAYVQINPTLTKVANNIALAKVALGNRLGFVLKAAMTTQPKLVDDQRAALLRRLNEFVATLSAQDNALLREEFLRPDIARALAS